MRFWSYRDHVTVYVMYTDLDLLDVVSIASLKTLSPSQHVIIHHKIQRCNSPAFNWSHQRHTETKPTTLWSVVGHLEHLLPDRNHLCFREMSHWMDVVSRNSLPLTVDPCLTVTIGSPTVASPSRNSIPESLMLRTDLGYAWPWLNKIHLIKQFFPGECMNMSHVFKVVDLDILGIWWYLHFFHWCRIICVAHFTVYAPFHLVAVANAGLYRLPVLLDIWRCDVLASHCSLATLAACTASGTLHFQDSVKSSVAKPKKHHCFWF